MTASVEMGSEPGERSICFWCTKAFPKRQTGGHRKIFCSASCKQRYHTALRRWAQSAIDSGRISIMDLKSATSSCTTEEAP